MSAADIRRDLVKAGVSNDTARVLSRRFALSDVSLAVVVYAGPIALTVTLIGILGFFQFNAINSNLNSMHTSMNTRFDSIDSRLDAMNQRIGAAPMGTRNSRSDVKVLQSEMRDLRNGMQDLRSGMQDLRSGMQDLRSGMQDLKAQNALILSILEDLQQGGQ